MTTWTDNWEATVGAGRPIRSPFEGSRGETMLASLSQVMTIEWREEKDSGSIHAWRPHSNSQSIFKDTLQNTAEPRFSVYFPIWLN